MFHGRTKPYTEIGIARLKCFRCGAKAEHQWQICANANRYLPICLECDIELNHLVIDFMNFPNRRELMTAYRSRFR